MADDYGYVSNPIMVTGGSGPGGSFANYSGFSGIGGGSGSGIAAFDPFQPGMGSDANFQNLIGTGQLFKNQAGDWVDLQGNVIGSHNGDRTSQEWAKALDGYGNNLKGGQGQDGTRNYTGGQQANTINANQENVANEQIQVGGLGAIGNKVSNFLTGYDPQSGTINPLTGLGYLPVIGQIASLANMGLWAAGKQPHYDPKTGSWTWGDPNKPDEGDGVSALPTFNKTTPYLGTDFSGQGASGTSIAGSDGFGGVNISGANGTGALTTIAGNSGVGYPTVTGNDGGQPFDFNHMNLDPATLAAIQSGAGISGAGTGGPATTPATETPATTTTPATPPPPPPFPQIQPYQQGPALRADPNSPEYKAMATMISNRSTSPLIANPFGANNPAYLSQTALSAGAPALNPGALANYGGRLPDESGGAMRPPPVHLADGGAVGPVPGWGGSMPWDYPGAGPRPQAAPAGPMGAPPAGMPMPQQQPQPMPQRPQQLGQPPNPMPNPMQMPQPMTGAPLGPQQPQMAGNAMSGGQAPQGFKDGGLVQAANAAKSAGRYGDDVLVHITPQEFHQFEAMHGPHSVNPETGLPEFGWFGNLLKKVAPVAAMAIPGLGSTIGSTLGIGDALGSAIAGAGIGAATNGGKGALYGGLTGLGGSLLSEPGSDFLQSLGLGPQTAGALMNAAIGAGGAATVGGNPLEGALINGALSYFAPQTTGKIKNAFAPKQAAAGSGDITLSGTPQSTPFPGTAGSVTPGSVADAAAAATAAPSGGSGSGLLSGLTGGNMGTILPLLLLASAAGGSGPKVITTPNTTKQPGYNYGQWMSGPYSGGLIPYDPTWAEEKKAGGGPIGGGALTQMASPAAQVGAMRGPGDGKSDSIQALVATGEHVIPAQDVSLMGNGDNEAGHARLEEMKQQVRRDGGQRDAKKPSPKQKKTPAQMMKKKGGKK